MFEHVDFDAAARGPVKDGRVASLEVVEREQAALQRHRQVACVHVFEHVVLMLLESHVGGLHLSDLGDDLGDAVRVAPRPGDHGKNAEDALETVLRDDVAKADGGHDRDGEVKCCAAQGRRD